MNGRRKFLKNTTCTGALLALGANNDLFGFSRFFVPPGETNAFRFGVAWYPEHWPETRWKKDIELMKSLQFNVVRVAEFAWSRLEPSEGRFEFDWLANAIDLAYKNGISVVIGTPTASPPAWMTSKYPEVLRMDEGGKPAIHGGRGHFNPSNPKYLEFCATIAQKLGERFGKHPGVIGWQIDNEYWPFSFDPYARVLFQNWLKERFGTLENLNTSWGNAYWSQDYSEWSQIPLSTSWQNPCLVLAVRQFKSHIIRLYQQNQVKVLRKLITPTQWITTNFHGEFQHCDGADLSQDLDFASFDPYVGKGHLDPFEMGFNLDRLRGFKNRSYWIMETQPGHVNWTRINNELNPNETRRMVWHQVAHGADAVLFWQWRSGIGGQEQYHGALLGQSGELKPIAEEVKTVGKEFNLYGKKVLGLVPNSKVAIWLTSNDQWAIAENKYHEDFDLLSYDKAWYRALRSWGVDVDIVSNVKDLSRYPLVLAPAHYITTPEDAESLLLAAKQGAQVILGARSGRKDKNNALIVDKQPGYGLHEALGAFVEEFYALESPIGLSGKTEGKVKTWAEWLTTESADTKVLATYSQHPWLNGKAAIVSRNLGKGSLTYLGCWPEKPALTELMGQFLTQSKIAIPGQPLPEGIEKCTRSNKNETYTFWINHAAIPIDVNVGFGTDLLTNKRYSGLIKMMPDEVLMMSI